MDLSWWLYDHSVMAEIFHITNTKKEIHSFPAGAKDRKIKSHI